MNPLEDIHLLHLILLQAELNFDYDASAPNPDRAKLRLLSATARDLIDGLACSYCDTRRSGAALLHIDPSDVAERATAALRQLGPLKRLQLEGLDDDALACVLTEASQCRTPSSQPSSPSRSRPSANTRRAPLEVLWLQRGHFSGVHLYTESALLPSMVDSPPLLPRLLEMDLGGCGELTDAGLECLTAAAPILARLRLTVNSRLQRPRLVCPWLRSATLAICANLEDSAVDALCSGAPLMRELSLWRCSSLHAPRISAPYLETLNLCECVELTETAIGALRACSALSTVLLAGCEALEANSTYWRAGKHLTNVDVSDMAMTNDAQLSAMCAASAELRRLDFSRSGHAVVNPSLGGPKLVGDRRPNRGTMVPPPPTVPMRLHV